MNAYEHPDVADLTLPAVLFALSDPVRLEIVGQLARRQSEEPPPVCASVGPEMPKSTRSHHLKVLREAGITYSAQHGRERRLSLRRADLDACWPGLLDAVLGDHPASAAVPGAVQPDETGQNVAREKDVRDKEAGRMSVARA